MQRTHSLTSISTANSARYINGDLSTESLISDSTAFSRKYRKQDKAPVFSFPNGEIFTPRTRPSKRSRPPRIVPDSVLQSKKLQPRTSRCSSMVSVRTAPVYDLSERMPHRHPHEEPNEKLQHTPRDSLHKSFRSHDDLRKRQTQTRSANALPVRSHSFHNSRQRSKQDLAFSLRNTKADTPTNISVPQLSGSASLAPTSAHRSSLTNNKYTENASNIVRQADLPSSRMVLADPTTYNDQGQSTASMVSSPSSVSLQCSTSNTPQTSMCGSECALDQTKVWDSPESVYSYRTARDPSPLQSIDETVIVHTNDVVAAKLFVDDISGTSQSPSSVYKGDSGDSDYSYDVLHDLGAGGDSSCSRNDSSLEVSDVSCEGPSLGTESTFLGNEKEFSGCESTAEVSVEIECHTDSFDSHTSSHTTLEEGVLTKQGKTLNLGGSSESSDEVQDNESSEKFGIQRTEESANFITGERNLNTHVSGSETLACSQLPNPSTVSEAANELTLDAVGPCDLCSAGSLRHRDTRDISGIPGTSVTPHSPCSQAYLRSEGSKEVETEASSEVEEENCLNTSITSKGSSFSVSQNSSEQALDSPTVPNPVGSSGQHPPTGEAGDAGDAEDEKKAPVSSLENDIVKNLPIPDAHSPSVTTSSSADAVSASSEISPYTESDLPELVERVVILDTLNENEMAGSSSSTSQTTSPIVEGPRTIGVQMPSSHLVDIDAYYSPSHINRFLTDDQEAVPVRRDVAIRNGAIEFNSRNPSMGSSRESILSKQLDYSSTFGHRLPSTRKSSPLTNEAPVVSPQDPKRVPSIRKQSMLDVGDADHSLSSPVIPTKPSSSKLSAHGKVSVGTPAVKQNASRHQKSHSGKYTHGEEPHGHSSTSKLKKFLKFMKFGSKQPNSKLDTKSAINSVASTPQLNRSRSVSKRMSLLIGDNHLDKYASNASKARDSKHPGSRTRDFLATLSGSKSHSSPSPVYTVRERSSSPNLSCSSSQKAAFKFDLPNYDVESDPFGDVLLKFDEVEKEIENETEILRKSKGKHNFFLKDDELTKAQIFDQQEKDIQLSSESLPVKSDSQSSSASMDNCSNDDESDDAPTPEHNAINKFEAFPQNDGVCSVTLTNEEIAAVGARKFDARRSYLKFIRQFADYETMKLNLTGFNHLKLSTPALHASVKKSSSAGKSNVSRNVKFANFISISETYAPHMYKRYNKAVTQYYLTDCAEIDRIKNELNSYKCYEMLVHENSKANTHFFY